MENTTNGPEEREPSVIRHIRAYINRAREAQAGKIVFTDPICEDLSYFISQADRQRVDLGPLRETALQLIQSLPKQEVRNVLDRLEGFAKERDEKGVAAFKKYATDRIAIYESDGRINQDDAASFKERLARIERAWDTIR